MCPMHTAPRPTFQSFAVSLLVITLAAACTHLEPRPTPPPPTPPPNAADLPCIQTPHGCISLNPDVTPATIHETICVPGYTKSVRPSTTYTNGVKRKLLRKSGLPDTDAGRYELDHIIPLALGGHPRKLSNLMLQPWDGEHGAKRKDHLEVRLHVEVCHGSKSLETAQHCIADDWEACASRNHVE